MRKTKTFYEDTFFFLFLRSCLYYQKFSINIACLLNLCSIIFRTGRWNSTFSVLDKNNALLCAYFSDVTPKSDMHSCKSGCFFLRKRKLENQKPLNSWDLRRKNLHMKYHTVVKILTLMELGNLCRWIFAYQNDNIAIKNEFLLLLVHTIILFPLFPQQCYSQFCKCLAKM